MLKIQQNKKYTILVVSEGMGAPKSFQLTAKSKQMLEIIMLGIFIIVVGVAMVIGGVIHRQSMLINNYDKLVEKKSIEVSKLEADNDHLKDKVSSIERTLENITTQQKVEALEKRLEATTKTKQVASVGDTGGMGGAEEEENTLIYVPTFKPCEGEITSYFGKRSDPFGKKGSQVHKGIDIANAKGTPIYAAASGVIEEAGYMNGYGYAIYIDHGQDVQTRYGHNSQLLVEQGEQVEKGQLIAKMGSTGNSTGNHLHFEILENGKQVNPEKLFQEENK